MTDQTQRSLDVTISGGSLGGLFAGIALLEHGHEPRIHERSTGELLGRGAGIVAQPVVRRVFERYGIADPDEFATQSTERHYLARDGRVQQSRAESMRFTSWDAVYRELRAHFPDDRYHAGSEVVDVSPARAAVTVDDGESIAADIVVAAEGRRSTTREQLFPAVEPAVADYVAWRGTVPEPDLPTSAVEAFDRRFVFYQGADHLILAYFIPGVDGEVDRGERRLNWVWYDTVDPADRSGVFTDTTGAERQFTVPSGSVRRPVFDERLARAGDVLPSVFSRAVRATEAPFVRAIYDLAVPEMVVDRVCLLGDATFVARPHTAAGTAKASTRASTRTSTREVSSCSRPHEPGGWAGGRPGALRETFSPR